MSLAPADLLETLRQEWEGFRLDTLTFAGAAEPIARSIAVTGGWIERERLAVLLRIKAGALSEAGRVAEATLADAECLKLLDELADEGDDNAVNLMAALSRFASIESLGMATGRRWALAPLVSPCPAPELVPPAAVDHTLPSRMEGLRWWLEDRWWDLRAWVSDCLWRAKRCCWAVEDRWLALRGK